MNEADLRAVAAAIDDFASRSAGERDAANPRWYVSHAKNLLDEVYRLRAALAESCEENRSVALAEATRTAVCPLLERDT